MTIAKSIKQEKKLGAVKPLVKQSSLKKVAPLTRNITLKRPGL
jgi:hypothetical protein